MKKANAYVLLHISVFIFGFTAILGKLIAASHFALVWNRMWIALPLFFLIPGFVKRIRAQSVRQMTIYLGIGCIVALHWITFYGSIKIGNSSSLTLACLGLSACFTSILEPFFTKEKHQMKDIGLGILALIGMVFISLSNNENNTAITPENFRLAIIWGIITTFLASIFSILNAKYAKKDSPLVMTFTEMFGGFILLSILMLLLPLNAKFMDFFQIHSTSIAIEGIDWLWLILLGTVCTTLAFVLNVSAMKEVSAFTANIAIGLEPVYGIILALIIFGEGAQFNHYFYIGVLFILSSIVFQSYPLLKNKWKRKILT